MGLSYLLRNQIRRDFNGQSAAELVGRYRWHTRFCGALFISSLLGAVVIFQIGLVASNDWRLLALAFGGGALVPLLAVYAWIRVRASGSFAEFLVASAVKDGCPMWLMKGALIFCGALLSMAIGGYIFGKGY